MDSRNVASPVFSTCVLYIYIHTYIHTYIHIYLIYIACVCVSVRLSLSLSLSLSVCVRARGGFRITIDLSDANSQNSCIFIALVYLLSTARLLRNSYRLVSAPSRRTEKAMFSFFFYEIHTSS